VIVQTTERQNVADPKQIRISLKIVEMLSRGTVENRRFFQDLQPRIIKALFRICEPESKGSFYHFQKLFRICLTRCNCFLNIVLTSADLFGSNLFINLLFNAVNSPVQDCIISGLVQLQGKKSDAFDLKSKLVDSRFAEKLCELIISDNIDICSSAVVLFQRVLFNSKEDSGFFLEPLRGQSRSMHSIFAKCSNPLLSIAFKQQFVSLFETMVSSRQQTVLEFGKSFVDYFYLLFPVFYSSSKFLEYSVSCQIKLLEILVFYTKEDSNLLDYVDWEFFLSGMFDRYKYYSLI
jgi:hypothetical protein